MDTQKKQLSRFLKKTLISSIPVVVLFLTVLWYVFAVRPQLVGDLGQLGKISFDRNYFNEIRKDRLTKHLRRDIAPGDTLTRIVTIGDSFSQMGDIGYSGYLAQTLDEPIMNLPYPQNIHNPFQGSWGMLQSGMFDGAEKPDIVILETAERFLIDCAVAFDRTLKPENPPVLYYSELEKVQGSEGDWRNYLGRMNKQASDWLKIQLRLEKNPVKHVKLSKAAFTIPGKEKDLYFMMENKHWTSLTPEELVKVRETVEFIHGEFAKRGIKMLFLIPADKYGLHQDQAVDNPYPRRETGRQYSVLDTLGYVINTYPILKPFVDRGETDINMADDSHWSYKASSIVADTLAKMIKNLEN